jgi:AhpD family alkylhydroperoxidase
MSLRIPYYEIAPQAIKAMRGVKTYIESSSIDARLRALVELRISQINGCAFCLDTHSQEARHAGETQQRLDCLAAWRETELFDDREKAALAWAESVTDVAATHVPDDVYEAARKQLSDQELVDLTVIVSMMNAWNRLAIAFKHEPKKRRE